MYNTRFSMLKCMCSFSYGFYSFIIKCVLIKEDQFTDCNLIIFIPKFITFHVDLIDLSQVNKLCAIKECHSVYLTLVSVFVK